MNVIDNKYIFLPLKIHFSKSPQKLFEKKKIHIINLLLMYMIKLENNNNHFAILKYEYKFELYCCN